MKSPFLFLLRPPRGAGGGAGTVCRTSAPRCAALLAATLCALFVAGAPAESVAAAKKRVLVLNSYHKGLSWTDNVVKGVESVFPPGSSGVELDFEYMDTKRYYDEGYFARLYEAYRYKYRNERFDVVLVSDNDAFNFLKEHHRDLFPGTPVVFCGINNFQDPMLAGLSLFTGVVEETDMMSTLQAALALMPGVRKVVVVNDRTTTGLAVKEELLKVTPYFQGVVEFSFLENLDIRELSDRVKVLTPDSVIFLLLVNRDRTGNFFAYEESLALIHREAPVPIFSVWDFYLGGGIVGGMLTSGFDQGRTAAELAKRMLQGEDVVKVPVIRRSPNRYMFDYRELSRFGIKSSRLPAGSIVINQPDTVYTRYKTFIWGFAGATSFLTAVILVLLVNISTRKRVEKALRESEEKYRDLYDNAPDMYHTVDRRGVIVDCNETEARMLGYRKDEMIGRPIAEFFTEETRQQFERDFPRYSHERTIVNLEREFVRRDGTTFPAMLNVFTEVDGRGELVRVRAIARDITDIKRVEEELRKSREQLRNLSAHIESVREEERIQIAREIHDELAQALTTLKLELGLLKKKLPAGDEPLAARTQLIDHIIDTTVESVQRISAELRPDVLDHLGLPAAIEWQALEFEKRSGISCELSVDDRVSLDQDRSTAVFRIFQETLTNIVRHAGATRVEVDLRDRGGTLVLEVRDNGRGITDEEMGDPRSFGLVGMRERAYFLGGTVTITGVPGRGTTVMASIPADGGARGG